MTKYNSRLRRLAPVVALVLVVLAASCTSNKKYGCPSHLHSAGVVVR